MYQGLIASTIFLVFFIFIMIVYNKKSTEKSNKKQERVLSKNQKFISTFVFFESAFGILLTVLLSTFLAGNFVVTIWLMLIGMVYMILGSYSKQILQSYGKWFMILGLSFGILNYIYLLQTNDFETMSNIGSWFGFFTLGVSQVFLGFKLKKEI